MTRTPISEMRFDPGPDDDLDLDALAAAPDPDLCGHCERDGALPVTLVRLTGAGTTDRFCSALCLLHYLADHLDELD